ncbi:uncharacterized protein LOC123388006 isoform X3 [Mustela putorius furo]|uniref:Uncharacterized protein LOC123388006 isoform X3 n=1 Tax=Mustela putorius furo TaxID=9669 RepID=A0A8U0UPM0_MUSPF|nr:uncharacterized protein LOC123388006 isoform X3 [Mustela putorius furo]
MHLPQEEDPFKKSPETEGQHKPTGCWCSDGWAVTPSDRDVAAWEPCGSQGPEPFPRSHHGFVLNPQPVPQACSLDWRLEAAGKGSRAFSAGLQGKAAGWGRGRHPISLLLLRPSWGLCSQAGQQLAQRLPQGLLESSFWHNQELQKYRIRTLALISLGEGVLGHGSCMNLCWGWHVHQLANSFADCPPRGPP